MNAHRSLIAGPVAALVLAGAARAAEPRAEGLEAKPRGEERAPWADVTGRLRAFPDGLLLELGGNTIELRLSGGEQAAGEVPSGAAPGARDLRATLTVNGRTTELLLRIVPPPPETPRDAE
jgi:hypothetical protein